MLEVISDRKIPLMDGATLVYTADVVSYSDYYPFGMLLDGRHGDEGTDKYRMGFQGQEMDEGIKDGEGNSINYRYRMHDPRIGRFFAVDPLAAKYPWYTPYQFSGNKVIAFVELEGLEEKVVIHTGHQPSESGETTITTNEYSWAQYNSEVLGIESSNLPLNGAYGEQGLGTLVIYKSTHDGEIITNGEHYEPYNKDKVVTTLGGSGTITIPGAHIELEARSIFEDARKEFNESIGGIRIDLSLRPEDQVYNINDAVTHIRNNVYKEKGACAKYVRKGFEAGGISTLGGPMNRPNAAGDYNDGFLQSRGFYEISKVDYKPIIGDVTVWEAGDWSEWGHVHMYLGDGKWGSDYIGNMFPYPKYDVPYSIFRR